MAKVLIRLILYDKSDNSKACQHSPLRGCFATCSGLSGYAPPFQAFFVTSGWFGQSGAFSSHPKRVAPTVRRIHLQKGNHGNSDWKVLVLWKNDSDVALRRDHWWRNVSHCMFRVQPERLPAKCTIDRLMAMGWLDRCGWLYDRYALCRSHFRRTLTSAIGRAMTRRIAEYSKVTRSRLYSHFAKGEKHERSKSH